MKYVLVLFLGIIVGVVVGAFVSEYIKSTTKTASQYVKVIVSAILVIGGAIGAFTIDWVFSVSYIVGIGVGISPYFTTLSKKETEVEE